jgi:hypothetical protein
VLYLSGHEILIIVVVFLAITFGPVAAGMILAMVRRRRGPPEG